MIESQQVLEWMAMGEAKGEIKGELRGEILGRISALLVVLEARFPPGAPEDLEAAIRATTNCEQLRSWLREAVKADSLAAFRQASGL